VCVLSLIFDLPLLGNLFVEVPEFRRQLSLQPGSFPGSPVQLFAGVLDLINRLPFVLVLELSPFVGS